MLNAPLEKEALNRLTADQSAEATFRGNRAALLYMRKSYLPEEEWITPEQVLYIYP